jgi:hypothetical protein
VAELTPDVLGAQLAGIQTQLLDLKGTVSGIVGDLDRLTRLEERRSNDRHDLTAVEEHTKDIIKDVNSIGYKVNALESRMNKFVYFGSGILTAFTFMGSVTWAVVWYEIDQYRRDIVGNAAVIQKMCGWLQAAKLAPPDQCGILRGH